MKTLEGEPQQNTFWSGVGQAVVTAGQAVGAGASALGRSVAAAYRAVDPDLRRQIFQAPLLGLMSLAPAPSRDTHAGAADANTTSAGPAGRPAVLLVHGLASQPGHFAAMQRYFTHIDGRPSRTVDLRGADSLDEMAERLRATIAMMSHAQESHAPPRLDLIAHSMGGIVARLALEHAATRARVRTLVTMATPHRGTHLARLAATPRTLDLRPDSAVIERLAAQDLWSTGDAPRLVALWSRSDTTILPPTSAAWDAAQTHHMADFTHLSYLLSPSSWSFLARLLHRPASYD